MSGLLITVQGYTTTPGDNGRVTITSTSTTGTLNCTGTGIIKNVICTNTGGSGTPYAIQAGGGMILQNCIAHTTRGSGFSCVGSPVYLIECEAYSCNSSNTAAHANFRMVSATVTCLRCVSHDSTNTNSAGYVVSGASNHFHFIDCIADTCYRGIHFAGGVSGLTVENCDIYNSTSDGFFCDTGIDLNHLIVENCSFTKNGGWGINIGSTTDRVRIFRNCGFGAGTEANTSGNISVTASNLTEETGSVNYPSNSSPYVDAANGDFTITLAEAKNAGRAAWTQTSASYGGTTGYNTIGAAQPQAGGGGGGSAVRFPRTLTGF
jgi:hypothetical protein